MAYQHPETGKFISKVEYERLTQTQTPKVDLPALIRAVPYKDVHNMLRRIETALDHRERFERSKSPNNPLIEFRRAKNFMRGNKRLGALFVLLNVNPDDVLNRTRKLGTRANLKGMMKLKKLLDYITGETGSFERVSLALFASTIIASNKGIGWISSQEQELILSNVPVGSLPKEVQEAIEEYKHKYMRLEGDSRNQSCQFRTTFDNLGFYDYSREDVDDDSNQLGINVNMDSLVIQYLNQKWELDKVS